MIDFIDLFAGVGGFHLGLGSYDGSKIRGVKADSEGESETGARLEPTQRQEANPPIGPDSSGLTDGAHAGSSPFRCVWASEWDKYAAQTYRKNFPDTPLSTDDIRKVSTDSIPDHDLLCAGFPCQAFSIAGKRRGLEEARGTLFYEIARIAERKRPSLLLLENVKGLLNHDEGRTFATILRVMGSIGYRLEWQVFNSKWFGVPQNRERVFIIGHLGAEPTRTVFPITEVSGFSVGSQGEARGAGSWVRDEDTGISGALRVGGSGLEENLIEDISPTIRVSGSGKGNPELLLAGTLSHQYGKDGSENLIDTQSRIRRLTPVECERLQGFPDGWTEGVSDTQRYKQMGNAVTVNVIRFLAPHLQSVLASEGEHK